MGAIFTLQQDNDPKHCTKLCKTYLEEKQSARILSVSQLYWAVVWAAWLEKVPINPSSLWEVLEEAWCEIDEDYLNKLTARIPKICKAVIHANGFFNEINV